MTPKIKNIFITIGVLLAASYIVFAYVYFAEKNNDRVCKNLYVCIKDSANLKFVTEKKISQKLNNQGVNPIGKTLSKIDPTQIEEVLAENIVIKEIQCYKTPNGNIKIDIWQREPLFRVISSKNENYYVDIEKTILPISSDFAAHVPIVTGHVNKSFATDELFNFIVFLQQDKFWKVQVQQINVVGKNEIELIPSLGNHIIILGTLENYQQKMNKLMKLYQDGLNVFGWNQYSTINLAYKNQIICTKKILP